MEADYGPNTRRPLWVAQMESERRPFFAARTVPSTAKSYLKGYVDYLIKELLYTSLINYPIVLNHW